MNKDILPELNKKAYIEELHEKYEIRFAEITEKKEIQLFLKKNWRSDHIFVYCDKLLDWQHLDKKNNRYNFVIAKEKKTNEIHSLLGFIPSKQYDCEIEPLEVWPCIWKSREDVQVKGLGVSLYHYMKEQLPIETISILGISEVALSIYKHWNFSTGRVKQLYFLNPYMDKYEMVKDVHISHRVFAEDIFELKEIGKEEYNLIEKDAPIFQSMSRYKSPNYYNGRFWNHPIYEYKMLEIVDSKNEPRCILVIRECTDGKKSACIRIVDVIGNLKYIANVHYALCNYLDSNNYEYIDILEVGQNIDNLKYAGFCDCDETGTIVPNYFEPFLLDRVELEYAYKTICEEPDICFFKADADQDRPNILER